MNPYEKYYLRKKIITGVVAVGAVALIGGALLLWKPWTLFGDKPDDQQQTEQNQNDVVDQVKENEPDLSITVGGKKVDCRLYKGDGWTIPVPMDWTVEEKGGAVHFYPKGSSAEGTCLTVTVTDTAAYTGSFIAVGAASFGGDAAGVERMFYFGGDHGYEVSARMTDGDREEHEKMMTAMARTMTVGSERPFASLYPMASEPEWQVVDNEVVLFLDKDGVGIESTAQAAVESKMNAWDSDIKRNFTGKYRLGTPEWCGSYTCVTSDYIDVFRVTVQYQIAQGAEVEPGEGQRVSGGWLIDEGTVLYIAVYHDGSVVTNRVSAWGGTDYFGAEFAAEVLK